jgi:NADPH:quinone reductase-like Zn-dependent oxidoreductase
MRAAWHDRYGADNVIQVIDTEIPTPKADELLVRVHASTVSRTDCALLSATPFFMRFATGLRVPKEQTLGTDFAGHVEAVGSAVTNFKVGDKVWGFDDFGVRSHAEYLVVSTNKAVAKMPASLSFAEAAASIEGAFYAYNFINKVSVGPGTKLLINGATGAIGSALLQLAKHAGATVTAVGNTKNLELLKSLGADRVIDYLHEDFTQDDETYDYVFDAVGKSTFGKTRHLLGPKGVYISSELGPGSQNIFLALLTPIFGSRKVVFPNPTDISGFMKLMGELAEAGEFSPVVDRSFTLDTIREAYAFVSSGQKTGSVVLDLYPSEQGREHSL